MAKPIKQRGQRSTLIDHSEKRRGKKLNNNINIHSGLVNSNLHFPTDRNVFVFIFLISGSDRIMVDN